MTSKLSKNEVEHRAGPSDLDSCKPNRTYEFQSDEITDFPLCAHSTEFTWKIPKCLDLPQNEGYFIDSTEFSFADAIWCLRMYPNGKKGDSTGRMHLLLVRLKSCNLEHRIHYRLGLKTRRDRKYGSFTHVVTFHANSVEMGILNLLTRSDIIQRRKSFAQKNILTAFCEISMIEEVQVLFNNTQLLKPSSEFQSLERSKTTQQLPVQSTLLDPDTYVWKITNFFELPLDEDYFIDSTEFSVANATWCMRMYPNGHRGCTSGWIHLMLVRLYSCNSEHQIHYRLGLKTGHNREHETLTHAVTFHASTKEIGVVNLLKRSSINNMRKRFTRDGNLTAFCYISLMKETKVVISDETKELQASSKFQSDEITDLPLCAHSTEFTWEITECFNLPENEGYFIDSTEFSFANATWCLRMYPNGKKGDSTGRMQLLLVRLNSCNLEHRIHYRLGLDKFNNRKYGSFTHVVTFHANAVEMGILNLLTRSDIIQRKKSFAQDDTLTAFCEMFIMEEVQVLSNNRQLLKTSSEFQSLEGSKMTQQLPVQSTLLDPNIYIWKITNFFELPLDEDYFIDSTEFSVENATWCMRMYPNGHRGHSSGWIHLMLVRLYSCNSEHRIHYRLGLRTRHNTEHETLTHVVTFHTNTKEIGVVNLLKRTTMYSMRKCFAQDGNVTVFCHISLIEETKVVCSDETKELQPSSKSQSVDTLEHSQHLYLKSTLSSQENLTWKVTNFFLLPMHEGYCVESAEFSFANATWCLRMYPNGQKGASSRYIQLLLVRLHHSYNSEHRIQYRLGLMAPRGKEYGCVPQEVIFHSNAEEMGIVNIMKRSDIIKSSKRLVPYDILTVFCKICMIEEIMLSNQTEVIEASSSSELFMDNVIGLKQDKNNTSSFGKLKNNIQKISSEDDGKVISKTFDELEKKKMSDDQFEMEKHEAELAI